MTLERCVCGVGGGDFSWQAQLLGKGLAVQDMHHCQELGMISKIQKGREARDKAEGRQP